MRPEGSATVAAPARLVCFDLDHTLLSGDSDVLWCDFLIAQGLLDGAQFATRNADMEARYKAGTVGTREFSEFYVSTLAGRTPAEWGSLRQRFLHEIVEPRIPRAARALVDGHQKDGACVLLTTATNRYITELTAQMLGIEHLIATEPALVDGRFTGRTEGTLNMREGKVERLHAWLAARGQALAACHSCAYSDSINDLPLLMAVNEAIAVDPDARLMAEAENRRWRVLRLER